jgi:hypothetical protein
MSLRNTFIVNLLPVKTTVVLRDEIYDYLIKKVERRRISEAINQALLKQLTESVKSMYGADPWLTTENLRDEAEPCDTPRLLRRDRILHGL